MCIRDRPYLGAIGALGALGRAGERTRLDPEQGRGHEGALLLAEEGVPHAAEEAAAPPDVGQSPDRLVHTHTVAKRGSITGANGQALVELSLIHI